MWYHLIQIWCQYPISITCTYFLMCIEFTIEALSAFFLGMAVDSLLNKNTAGFITYCGLSVASVTIAVCRRCVDTRTFVSIWKQRTQLGISTMLKNNVKTPAIISRSHLLNVYGDFMEYTLPSIISAAIDILVAWIMIWRVVPIMGYITLPLIVFGLLIQRYVSNKIYVIETAKQRVAEQNDLSIIESRIHDLNVGLETTSKLVIERSDLEAFNWCLIDVMSIVSSGTLLLMLVGETHTTGDIVSTLAYSRQLFFKTNFMNFLHSAIRQMKLSQELLTDK